MIHHQNTPATVFATGTSGTIGRHLLDRVGTISFTDFCRDLYLPSQLDLADSTVVHLGGVIGARAVESDPSLAREVNVSKTVEFARLCIDKGVKRFVYVSTAHVYKPSDSPVNEERALEPSSEYASQKLLAEQALSKLSNDFGFDFVSLRLFSVLSLDGKPDTLGARVARAIESGAPLFVPFAADCRDFLSPRVYADLIMQIATKDSVDHGVVNVGSGKALSVEEAVRRLLKSTNAMDLVIEFDSRFSAIPQLVADNLRLQQILGEGTGELSFPERLKG